MLGQREINIAAMQVGRTAISGNVMVLSVDCPVPEDVLAEIMKLQYVTEFISPSGKEKVF